MAVLQNIRNRSTLLLVVIGIALAGFIVSEAIDSLSSGATFGLSNNYILKVGDESVSPQEFEVLVEKATNQNSQSSDETFLARERAWNNAVRTLVMEQQYEKVGIDVSNKEILDMYKGEYLSPLVRQQFGDPRTNQVDRQRVAQLLDFVNLDPSQVGQDPNQLEQFVNARSFIINMEEQMIQERKSSKFMKLLQKAMYTNSIEKELQEKERITSVEIEYLSQPFTSIPDSAIQVSSNDIKQYYKEHIDQYQREESRNIKYVTFPIEPSTEDKRKAQEEVYSLRQKFEEAQDDMSFVNLNSDIAFRHNTKFNLNKEQVEEVYRDWAFNSEVGATFEPQLIMENQWKIAKLHAVNYVPDSVKVAVLSLRPSQTLQAEKLLQLSDSLLLEARAGADFPKMIEQYNENATPESNGIWITEEADIDSCFYGSTGDVYRKVTQDAILLIKVTDQAKRVKKVKLAKVVKYVHYSNETEQKIFYAAADMHAKIAQNSGNFDSIVIQQNMYDRTATLGRFDYSIPGVGSSRDLVRWVYDSKEGYISEPTRVNDNLVIAIVEKINEAGATPLTEVAPMIKLTVLQEKRIALAKKTMEDKLKGLNDMQAMANALNVTIDRSTVSSENAVLNTGSEPSLVAALSQAKDGELIYPIAGNTGVFAVKVLRVNTAENASVLQARYLQQDMQAKMIKEYMLSQQVIETLEEEATIKDQRYKFGF